MFADMFASVSQSKQSNGMIIGIFGHKIEDQDVLDMWKRRSLEIESLSKKSILIRLKSAYMFFYNLLFGPRNLLKSKHQYTVETPFNLVKTLRHYSSANQVWTGILDKYYDISLNGMKNHGPVSFGSSIKNGILKMALEGAQENNPNLESDFNLMTSSCTDVISAEVPNSLLEIAKSVENKEAFRQLSDEEALKTLQNGTNKTSKMFKEFLERHGHRGYRELDPMHLPWGDNPIPCIKNIKAILSGKESSLEPKRAKSVDEVMNELKTPLSFTRKLLIRKFLLPWSRDGVGYRELSKYFMIWLNNQQRQGFWYLANKMVAEGIIPSADLFFYLTPIEIDSLCNGERDALILMKARLRKRLYPKMDKYKFEEFIKGPEMKPRNLEQKVIPITSTNGALVQMSGTPVSNGSVKARVCVSEDITEADNIQFGDILITYSTDIGWSPYFPLLSGIITEIGGTLSHGAVIAREYGIPSLIAVEGACRTFKTGDICVLDTETKTITKVE